MTMCYVHMHVYGMCSLYQVSLLTHSLFFQNYTFSLERVLSLCLLEIQMSGVSGAVIIWTSVASDLIPGSRGEQGIHSHHLHLPAVMSSWLLDENII